MKKKTVKWAVFLAILLAVGLYVRPMPLSKVLPVEDGQVVDFFLIVWYSEPAGDTGGYRGKKRVYQLKEREDSAVAQALSDELQTIRCRRSLNPFAGKPTYSSLNGNITITWSDGEGHCDFEMVSYKKAARIYYGRYYGAYVLEEGAYARIAAVLQTYGILQE